MVKLAKFIGVSAATVCLTYFSGQPPGLAQQGNLSQLPTQCDPAQAQTGLQSEDSFLGRKVGETGTIPTLEPKDTGVYRAGETVYLVLRNTGPFQRGIDGKHQVEIDVLVKGPNGKVLLSAPMLLKEKGRVNLQDDTAPAPYGNVNTTRETPPGKYIIVVTVYDMVACTKVIRTRPFRIVR